MLYDPATSYKRTKRAKHWALKTIRTSQVLQRLMTFHMHPSS